MQSVEEFFAKPLTDVYVPLGTETDWLTVGNVTIRSGYIAIGDTTLFPDCQVEVEIQNGTYLVQTKGVDFGSDRRLSRLRAISTETNFMTEQFEDISVDFARVGICDPRVFLEALESNTDSGKDLDLYEAIYGNRLNAKYGVITLNNENMVFVQSGWGDGSYDVFRLYFEDQLVGIEAIFITDDDLRANS